jgi:hypothetical protein
MRRSNREMARDLKGENANTAGYKEKTRMRIAGDLCARSLSFWLIATLTAALPGFALEYNGNHEFRGSANSVGSASKTEDGSAGVNGTSGAATVSIPIAFRAQLVWRNSIAAFPASPLARALLLDPRCSRRVSVGGKGVGPDAFNVFTIDRGISAGGMK